MSLPNWDFGWPEPPNTKKRRVDDDPFAFSVPPAQPTSAYSNSNSSNHMPGAYTQQPSQLPPLNSQPYFPNSSQSHFQSSPNFGQGQFSPITSGQSGGQLPPLQSLPSQNSPMFANQSMNSSPQSSNQPSFQQQWQIPSQQQQSYQQPSPAFQSLPQQSYQSAAPQRQQQSYLPAPKQQQQQSYPSPAQQAYQPPPKSQAYQPPAHQAYQQPRSQPKPFQPKPQFPPLSQSLPPPPQYQPKSLAQPSFDAQMFQSLQSSQFSQSQPQSQGSSYSPPNTQVQWQSPSSVSQQLPRSGSMSQVQQASPQLQARPSPQMQRPSPQLQTGLSPQLQTRPSPQLQTRPSPQLQQRSTPQAQQRPSPQMQQRQSPQVQQRPSPQLQQRPSPQLQQRPSPQGQHQPPPQFVSPQEFASPQMPVQSSPQLFPPQQPPQQLSPQAPQAYLPQQPPPPQQPFDFPQYLPPPQQQQQQQQQQQTYQQPVPKFDLAQWEQNLEHSQQAPMMMPHQLPPPPPPLQQQPVRSPQQVPQQPAPQQHYGGYNGPGGPEQYGFSTPSSVPGQGEAPKIVAPSPTLHMAAIPPSFMNHPTPSPSQLSSLPTPSPRPSHPSSMPKSKSASSNGTPRTSSTPQSVPAKRKSKSSQVTPRPPQQPSSRPVPHTTPAGKAVPSQVPTPSPVSAPLPEAIPIAPLLFNTAVSAHRNATYHLQQVFVPQDVQDGDEGGMKRDTATGKVLFTHDPNALNVALRLLVMALDLLRTGFYMPDLSDSERAAFGLEFATVASKVLATGDPVKKLLAKEELVRVQVVIDHKRLASDVDDVMTKTLAAARSPHLKHYRQGVELVSARLAFMKDKANHAKRIIKQALAATPREDVAHRYNLHLLHMNHLLKAANVELLQVVKEFEADARAQGHQDIVLLAHIIRIRAHFSLRRWDNLLATLDESEALFGTDDVFTSGNPETASFRLVLLMHYLNMRALYHGRAADDTSAKKQLSRLYPLMDRAMDKGMLSELRSSGGMVTIPLRAPNGSIQELLVQSTPINVLWALTYLSSVVARRDLLGSFSQCRTLNHTRAMRQFEHCTHPDDLWDSGFSFRHGVAEALELRHKVNKLRAEVMMEEALALLCRSSFEQVTKLLSQTVEILHANKLFLTHSHQLALLYGHFMHAIGLHDQAVRYYKAAQSLLVAGSEMRLIVDINLMAAQGGFSNLQLDLDRATQVNVMADQCRAGTNGALNAVGLFLLSLTDPERVSSKRKLTFSYEICRRGKLNILYALIFAFTTAQHLFGDRERQLKQLESGRDIARLLGGKDRPDGCGQLPLGLWYCTKLRDHYRLDGRFGDEKAAAADAQRHLQRMQEVYAYGRAHFPPRISI